MTDTDTGIAHRRPTMMDVAERAGVSQATVSLVLNGSPGSRLTPETRSRVLDAVKSLGYQFVRRSSSTASQTRAAIVFVADEVSTDPWMSLAYEGARDKALEFGITTFLAMTHGDADMETAIVRQSGDARVIGFLYGTTRTRLVDPPKIIRRSRTVLVNCYDKHKELPAILPGDQVGGRVATQRLISSGRRRIALINGDQGSDASRERLKGYRQALSSNDIPYSSALVHHGNWEPSSGYRITHELMALSERPDAIFCANDMIAVGCFDALREHGVRVPEDISVIGFDDRAIAQFTHPPLTTLTLPHYQMGAIAAERLIDSSGGLYGGPNPIKVECPLVERASV